MKVKTPHASGDTQSLWTQTLEAEREVDGPLTASVHEFQGLTWLSLTGELDAYTAPLLEQRLFKAEEDSAGNLVINLAELTFMDCRGLTVLEQAKRRASRRCQPLAIVNAQPQVDRLLKFAGKQRLVSDAGSWPTP